MFSVQFHQVYISSRTTCRSIAVGLESHLAFWVLTNSDLLQTPLPLPRPWKCVRSSPVPSCFSFLAAVVLLCCLFCFAPIALLHATPFSFLCSACVLCAPLPVSAFVVLSFCFPVVGCGWLSLFPPSSPPPACVCVCTALGKIVANQLEKTCITHDFKGHHKPTQSQRLGLT